MTWHNYVLRTSFSDHAASRFLLQDSVNKHIVMSARLTVRYSFHHTHTHDSHELFYTGALSSILTRVTIYCQKCTRHNTFQLQ